MSKHAFESFTGKYKLSKTLRFALRPQGKTLHFIQERGLISVDEARALEYKKAKETIDDYHRYFIEEVLSGFTFESEKLLKAYELFKSVRKGSAEAKTELDQLKEKLCKEIGKAFAEKNKIYSAFGKTKDLLKGGKKQEAAIVSWLEKQDFADKAERIKTIRGFSDFTTYFTGFDQNRENVYSGEAKHTSVGYRVVCENLMRHFENCLAAEQHAAVLKPLLGEAFDLFRPDAFSRLVSQKQITEYNQIIGSQSDLKTAEKGINQKINEHRQKQNLKPRDLPLMKELYKQILSDREDGFHMDVFENDADCIAAVKAFARVRIEDFRNLADCAKRHFVPVSGEDIGLAANALQSVSNELFGDFRVIREAVRLYSENHFKTKKEKEQFEKREVFCAGLLNAALAACGKERDDLTVPADGIFAYARVFAEGTKDLEAAAGALERLGDSFGTGPDRERDVQIVKTFLDAGAELLRSLRPFVLKNGFKPIECPETGTPFYLEFEKLHDAAETLFPLYNKVRNHVVKKPYSDEKIKINFDCSTLLNGWDLNKETSNLGVVLLKDGRYYLGILNKSRNKGFDYREKEDDSARARKTKQDLAGRVLADATEPAYEKMIYKLLSNPGRDLPHVFFSKKGLERFPPSEEVLNIYETDSFKTDRSALKKYIDHYKTAILRHEWNGIYPFRFRPSEDYQDFSEFCADVEDASFRMEFERIRASYIDELVEKGDLYLFQIYGKDFSGYSKGKPNLHTLYWKAAFEPENLRNLVVRLNGEAEIFWRKASLKKDETAHHPAGEPIGNKNPLNPKKQSVFDYELVKDRRFTEDQFLFHCPLSINARCGKESFAFNNEVRAFLRDGAAANVIGIDRGERNLLAYSVIDRTGRILEQGSLNILESDNRHRVDYHDLLGRKAGERDEARRNWKSIENIKELKAGYLSHVVHKLAELMIRYNAVIALEDLNFGFKRGRFQFESQVYQKFEKALIDKLNCLVFKDAEPGTPGHYLRPYQLTARFKSFEKMGKQTGFLFYVPAAGTSKIDPATGFVNLIHPKYENETKSRAFFGGFDSIRYNPDADLFEFACTIPETDVRENDVRLGRRSWTICSCGKDRYIHRRIPNTRNFECVRIDVTAELKKLFSGRGIRFEDGGDLRDAIRGQDGRDFHARLTWLLDVVLMMRYSGVFEGQAFDYILSPVRGKNGKFFDSREVRGLEAPCDADANGAYNIARKGLYLILNISEKLDLPKLSRNEWLNFCQQ